MYPNHGEHWQTRAQSHERREGMWRRDGAWCGGSKGIKIRKGGVRKMGSIPDGRRDALWNNPRRAATEGIGDEIGTSVAYFWIMSMVACIYDQTLHFTKKFHSTSFLALGNSWRCGQQGGEWGMCTLLGCITWQKNGRIRNFQQLH